MKKNFIRSAVATLLFMLVLGFTASTTVQAATSKPGVVKNLKKVKANKNSIKISFKKVKGAAGYQILIYQKIPKGTSSPQTPLVYAKKTKNTTYTIKNLMPGNTYTIKVRAYNKKGVYGKKASVKIKTTGARSLDIVCSSCGVSVPYYKGNKKGWDYASWLAEHIKAVYEVHGERHCGFVIW